LVVAKKKWRHNDVSAFMGAMRFVFLSLLKIASRFVRIEGILLHQQNMPRGEKQ
jgi:hypothetical protein